MMKLFVLEDDSHRMKQIRECVWQMRVLVDHADSCQQISAFRPFYDLVLLDHFLGTKRYGNQPDDGRTFAKLIRPKLNPGAIVLTHAYDLNGARDIMQEIPWAVHIPFGVDQYWQAVRACLNPGD